MAAACWLQRLVLLQRAEQAGLAGDLGRWSDPCVNMRARSRRCGIARKDFEEERISTSASSSHERGLLDGRSSCQSIGWPYVDGM